MNLPTEEELRLLHENDLLNSVNAKLRQEVMMLELDVRNMRAALRASPAQLVLQIERMVAERTKVIGG